MPDRLTEAHRLSQARLGAITVARLRDLFHLLDPTDLDGTFERWIRSVVPVIDAQRSVSIRVAAAYLRAFKTTNVGVDAATPIVRPGPADLRALTTSMLVTGPVSLKRATARGVQLADALSVAEASSSAAGMRYVLDAGRSTLTQSIRADRDATGFVRVTSGNACAFCSDLAGTHIPDDEAFPAHDGCSCSAEPVYATS